MTQDLEFISWPTSCEPELPVKSDDSVFCKRGDTILSRAGFRTRELVQNDGSPSVDTGTPLLGETQIYD